MKSRRFSPKRYQVTKQVLQLCRQGHPWIFRKNLSSAAEVFTSGALLKLVDPSNETWGYGIYDPEGLIAIRVLKEGSGLPDPAWVQKKIRGILEKRAPLRQYTDAFRAVHGENDGFPGIVIDVYADTGVLQTYSPSLDIWGRFVGIVVAQELGLKNLIWKLPNKRVGEKSDQKVRALRGHIPRQVTYREGKLNLTVEVGSGQKSGTFLDLRGLRKWLTKQKLENKRVLNLFSYTGTLGLACEVAGAREVVNVDVSEGALAASKKFHSIKPGKQQYVAADIFEWFPQLPAKERYDLIIIDPPQMTSSIDKVPVALKAYRNLYKTAITHLNPGGRIVGACCTSRIPRALFKKTVGDAITPALKIREELKPEDDHPVTFPQGDYLKILVCS